jgi:hypothetical protein
MNGDIRDRLVKLVRLLSSDKEGERLAAVAGIERALRSAGLSFHDLADTIANRIVQVVKKVEVQVDRTAADSWVDAADEMLGTQGLTDYERNFVRDIKNKFKLRPRQRTRAVASAPSYCRSRSKRPPPIRKRSSSSWTAA